MSKRIKGYIPYIIIFICVILIRSFLYTPIKVNGTSMEPTLVQNEIMILDKISLKKGIKRYDIVVIKEDSKYIIKRVIGLPGESIAYINGELYINKKQVGDKYSKTETKDFDEVYLKDDEYFVMGDNRAVSADSRVIGPVNISKIKGKTSLIIFPFSKIGTVK